MRRRLHPPPCSSPAPLRSGPVSPGSAARPAAGATSLQGSAGFLSGAHGAPQEWQRRLRQTPPPARHIRSDCGDAPGPSELTLSQAAPAQSASLQDLAGQTDLTGSDAINAYNTIVESASTELLNSPQFQAIAALLQAARAAVVAARAAVVAAG